MISRKAISTAFEVIVGDLEVGTVVVYCNHHKEAVRVDRWRGGAGIHKGTYLCSMGSLFPEEKAHVTRETRKYGVPPKIWTRRA
jgi:hypothetical protein